MRDESPISRRSPWLIRWFLWYIQRYVRRHFRAVRVSRQGRCPPFPAGPILLVTNHPSWWDPLIGMLVAAKYSGRELYAPMDADAIARHWLFGRLGLFGIAPESFGGARRFLSIGTTILERPNTMLAVTAQGRFVDTRERPVALRPGIGHLASRLAHGFIIPIAFEYLFWSERLPEALVYFGHPIPIVPGLIPKEWTQYVARGLESAQDHLANEAQRRDPSLFETILDNASGNVEINGR